MIIFNGRELPVYPTRCVLFEIPAIKKGQKVAHTSSDSRARRTKSSLRGRGCRNVSRCCRAQKRARHDKLGPTGSPNHRRIVIFNFASVNQPAPVSTSNGSAWWHRRLGGSEERRSWRTCSGLERSHEPTSAYLSTVRYVRSEPACSQVHWKSMPATACKK